MSSSVCSGNDDAFVCAGGLVVESLMWSGGVDLLDECSRDDGFGGWGS